jgi:hypothetical protein
MRRASSILLLLTVCACGGNVVVDVVGATTHPGGTGGLGTGGVVGNSTTTSLVTTGPVTTGPVTVGTSTTGPNTSVGVTTVAVSSAATTTTTTTTTVASSTGGFGACTNPLDESVLATHATSLNQDLYTCTVNQLGNIGGTTMCLVGKDGFTFPCAQCFAIEGQCGAAACSNQCINGVPNPPCLACLAAHCDGVFTGCSGIPFPG